MNVIGMQEPVIFTSQPQLKNELHPETEYMYEFIKKVCEDIGPGCPGSPQEKERGMFIKAEMEKICDTVEIEEYKFAPKAYTGWFKLGAILATIGFILFYLSLLPLNPLLFASFCLIISIFIFFMLLLEFILEKEFVDIFYPKATSFNVIGKILPKNKASNSDSASSVNGENSKQKLLIFGGHHDSAFQFTWLRYLGFGYYLAEGVMIIGVLVYIVGSTIWFFSLLVGNPADWVKFILMIFSVTILPLAFISGVFFNGTSKNGGQVPGACDNLSAVAESLAVGKYLKEHPELIPPNTEIRLMSCGSEEAGDRGSKRYVKRHLAELKQKETYVLMYETLYNPKNLIIFSGDRNGTLHNNRDFVQLVDSARRSVNVPGKIKNFTFGGGGTDAQPFTENGIKATCIFGMAVPQDMIHFYHTFRDNPSALNKEILSNALKISLALVDKIRNNEK